MKMEKECFCIPWMPSATKAIFGNLLFPRVLFEQKVHSLNIPVLRL